jgi:hypothetical protein
MRQPCISFPLKGGATKSKGEVYCFEGDVLGTAMVFSEDVITGVAMVEIEE